MNDGRRYSLLLGCTTDLLGKGWTESALFCSSETKARTQKNTEDYKKKHTEVLQVNDCSSAHAHAGASDFEFQLVDKIPFEGLICRWAKMAEWTHSLKWLAHHVASPTILSSTIYGHTTVSPTISIYVYSNKANFHCIFYLFVQNVHAVLQ
jgi:hypothetical protein